MAEHRPRFVGTYEHGLDDKGRMVLPAKIRAQLGETAMLGMADRCLGLWTLDGFDQIADTLSKRVEAGDAKMDAFRQFMASAAEITPDQQGRIVIPQRLRDYAGLGAEVVVNGRLDRAEVWDRARWLELTPASDADVAQTMADLRL